MIEAIIFDVDGTLVDSNELHVLAWDRAFRKFGRSFPRIDLRNSIGKGGDQYLPTFLSKEEIEEFGEELEEYRTKLFQSEYLPVVRPFPEVRELFERLRKDSKRVALASSGKGKELEHYKKLLGVEHLIDCQMTSDDADRSKPAPDLFTASLEKLDLKAAQVVAVGDTPYDAKAAGKVGIRTVGVLSGGFSREELEKSRMVELYLDVGDLRGRYDNSVVAS